MKIIIGKNAGFCHGVKRAINKAVEESKKGKVCCLGEIVHNQNVINNLEKQGIEFIDNIEKANTTTIIRAHGEPKSVYRKAEEMGINILDLTCPSVRKIYDIVYNYSKEGYYVVIAGKEKHPEVIGIKSYIQSNYIIISNVEELCEKLPEIKKEKNVLLISQTTYNTKLFNEIAELLSKNLNEDIKLVIKNTICLTAENRQEETIQIAQRVDAMIIVGDKKSSNTTELFNIASNYCENTQFVFNVEEVDLDKIKGKEKIGIMAGAATPKEDILKIKELLLKLDK